MSILLKELHIVIKLVNSYNKLKKCPRYEKGNPWLDYFLCQVFPAIGVSYNPLKYNIQSTFILVGFYMKRKFIGIFEKKMEENVNCGGAYLRMILDHT